MTMEHAAQATLEAHRQRLLDYRACPMTDRLEAIDLKLDAILRILHARQGDLQ